MRGLRAAATRYVHTKLYIEQRDQLAGPLMDTLESWVPTYGVERGTVYATGGIAPTSVNNLLSPGKV